MQVGTTHDHTEGSWTKLGFMCLPEHLALWTSSVSGLFSTALRVTTLTWTGKGGPVPTEHPGSRGPDHTEAVEGQHCLYPCGCTLAVTRVASGRIHTQDSRRQPQGMQPASLSLKLSRKPGQVNIGGLTPEWQMQCDQYV